MWRYLVRAGQRDPDRQAPAPDGWDDLGGGVTAQDETTRCHVLLHGPAQRVLSVFGQSVHLGQQHHCRRHKPDAHQQSTNHYRGRKPGRSFWPLNSLCVLDWICWLWAMVLMSSWITTRSLVPASLPKHIMSVQRRWKTDGVVCGTATLTLDWPLNDSCWRSCWSRFSFSKAPEGKSFVELIIRRFHDGEN